MINLKHTRSYHRGHPNPQKFRKDILLLDGEWKFLFDREDVGEKEHFEKGLKDFQTIIVPFAYQSKASTIGLTDEHVNVVWYQKDITLKEIAEVELLNFQAVDYLSKLYVNGEFVGEHEGGYDFFSYDIAPYLHEGENSIILRVEDRKDADQIRGKQTSRETSYECFYLGTTGIVGSTYIEHLHNEYIQYFAFKGDYASKTLKIDILSSKMNLDLQVEVFKPGEKEAFKKQTFRLEDNHYEMGFDEIRPYSHDDPYLYDVVLTLYKGKQVMDQIETYVGFISISSKGGHIFINDKDTYLVMALDQGYFPDVITTAKEEQIIKDINLIDDYGFNAIRKHEKIESPLFFYYLDIAGIYVWQECPSAMEYSKRSMAKYRVQLPRMIKDHFSHPSIIAYVIFNESWGIQNVANDEVMQIEVDMLYDMVKKMSQDRFVISNDGWEHTKSDLITFHNYALDGEVLNGDLNGKFEELKSGHNVMCNTHKKFFASDLYKYKGQPILCTEFAGIALDNTNGANDWGYGRKENGAEAYIKRYASLLDSIESFEDIRGFCMTQLTDVESEKNGLVDFERNAKVDAAAIKKLHERFLNK